MNYIPFGKGTGLRVSQVCLGSAVFGSAWGYGATSDEVHGMLDAYQDAGGNFIDTADFYQFGQAESLIGDFLRNRRSRFVLATKYSLGNEATPNVLSTGNSLKNMLLSIEGSLNRLQTDYIDLLWVHMADGITSSEEIARGLDLLVRTGKVRYVGLSDFPAWRVARAATIAQLRGWAPIVGLQLEYSLVERSAERELLPMARALGMAITAWSPLAGGLLTGKYRLNQTGRADTFGAVVHRENTARTTAILDVLLAIAEKRTVPASHVALAWLASKGVIPIIGPRLISQLQDNLAALHVRLDPEQIRSLDAASAIEAGFPHDFLAEPAQYNRLSGGEPGKIAFPDCPID